MSRQHKSFGGARLAQEFVNIIGTQSVARINHHRHLKLTFLKISHENSTTEIAFELRDFLEKGKIVAGKFREAFAK